jgi:predicted  nucleic acid-binding Zn-ribbon protein
LEQYHQLQKEFEELKDAKSTAEAGVALFKLRVQQLEKEAQSHNQLFSKLENQVLFLSEDKPLQSQSLDSVKTHCPPPNIIVIIKIMKFLALGSLNYFL